MEGFKSAIRNIRTSIFSPKVSLEKRITYAMVFCAMFGELFGFIESFFIGLPLIAVLLPLISFVILVILSFWGLKTKKTRLFATIAISITALIIFPLMFFANAGLHGGMPYYFLLTAVCTALALRGRIRICLFVLILAEYTGLFFLYRFFPQGFIPMSHEDAFVDQLCSMLLASIVLFSFSFIVSKQNHHDRQKIEQLSLLYEHQANTDELTGLFNRRYFNNFLKLAIATVGDSGSLHLAMFDIDDFKHVNDKYGHPFGDAVLKKFARILQEKENLGATACRYGGEEFLLLIPKKSRDEALEIVKQILHETRTTIDIEENRCITVSAGFITCSGSMNFEQTMEEVDKKLYLAKKAGKDRVIS